MHISSWSGLMRVSLALIIIGVSSGGGVAISASLSDSDSEKPASPSSTARAEAWITHTPVLRTSPSLPVSSAPEEPSSLIQQPLVNPSQGERQELLSTEDEVPVMEETVVTGDYFDPFADEETEYVVVDDPWEGFNSTMFTFNRNVDRYVFKPIATGYDWILPDPVERGIGNALHNIGFIPRLVNNLFQGKMGNAGVVLGRFFINSTAGLGGIFDVAKNEFGLEANDDEDTGQTLAVWGVESGPYLVLPFLPPMTVRDGVGFIGDVALNPTTWLIPTVPLVSMGAGEQVNERSQNLELFEGVEDSTVDLYGAVREGYIQKRAAAINK